MTLGPMPTNRDQTQHDEVLANRMRGGDAMAFADLATRYWDAIHRIGRNMLGNCSAAGDLTEATFLTALHSKESFPPGVPFRVSLYRVALADAQLRLASTPKNRSHRAK